MVHVPLATLERTKPATPPAREDDHEPGGAEELLDRGRELADPQQVEDDVEQAAVEIDRGDERPPPARAATPASPVMPSVTSAPKPGESRSNGLRNLRGGRGSSRIDAT